MQKETFILKCHVCNGVKFNVVLMFPESGFAKRLICSDCNFDGFTFDVVATLPFSSVKSQERGGHV